MRSCYLRCLLVICRDYTPQNTICHFTSTDQQKICQGETLEVLLKRFNDWQILPGLSGAVGGWRQAGTNFHEIRFKKNDYL